MDELNSYHFLILYVPLYYTVQMLLARGPGLPPQWFGPCPQPPLIAGLNYKERQRLHNTARDHRLRCKWAVDRLRAELMRTVARRRFVLARSSSPIPARASRSASESPKAEGGGTALSVASGG